MCGIFCYIYRVTANNVFTQWSAVKENITRRGPDNLSTYFETINDNWAGQFTASVLWMQGSHLTTQPCIDDKGNILLWNGDIFSGPLANHGCDTLALLRDLESRDNIYESFKLIEGPYSFIYFQKKTNLLFFGRDPIGRHSLLINIYEKDEYPSLTLCSSANKDVKKIIELPAIGIFSVDFNDSVMNLSCSPWNHPDDYFFSIIDNLNFPIDVKINEPILELESNNRNNLLSSMTPNLAYLNNIPDNKYNNIQEIIDNLLEDLEWKMRVMELWKLLKGSVKIRVQTKPEYCKNCIKLIINNSAPKNDNYHNGEQINCDHTKIGILFSGGLDSTIIAAITDEFVPKNESIDLINVAFEKVKKENVGKNSNVEESLKFDVPDRKTGCQALKELQKIFPQRKWNFINVNITRKELQEYCSKKICHLIYPLKTILDESLGCAVWFASRGSGILLSSNELYESSCRVLLLGMGADELFGGYTRHRTVLRRLGWNALNDELNKELSRISERNLGRDDRVVSDHGRQSRLPFLDEKVVEYVQGLKPWERCCPIEKMPTGLGDKLLLRLLAYKIGLKETANFPKRAFQFGSRIANSKENASETSNWLK